MEIDVISKQEVEQIALNTICEYIKPKEWCEKGSVRQDIKDLTGKISSHDKSLHNMFEAINAISNMVGTHKDLMDSYKELFDTLSADFGVLAGRIKLLEEK